MIVYANSLCDRNHFWILKGIAALAAVIALFFRSYYDFNYASYIVHGAAAVFFFCSGFGVSESYRYKSGLYLLYDGVFDFFGSQQDWKMHMVMFGVLLAGAVAISALRELLARRNRKMRRRERRR